MYAVANSMHFSKVSDIVNAEMIDNLLSVLIHRVPKLDNPGTGSCRCIEDNEEADAAGRLRVLQLSLIHI